MNTGDKHFITDDILRLVRQAIADNRGSQAAFCRMTGITPYNLSKLLSGKKKFVFGDDWNRLCDFFPEIDNRAVKIHGNGNAVNGSVIVNDGDVEKFRSALISQIIMLDIDPVAKDTVLKTIAAFKQGEK